MIVLDCHLVLMVKSVIGKTQLISKSIPTAILMMKKMTNQNVHME
jgi:hypothetical protein